MIVLVWLVDGKGEYFFNCSGAQAVSGYRAAIAEPVEAGGDYLRSVVVSEGDVVLGDLAVLAGDFVGAAAGISQEAPEKNLICPAFFAVVGNSAKVFCRHGVVPVVECWRVVVGWLLLLYCGTW